MSQLFLVVLSLSVSGVLVGLLVLSVRPIFGRFFSKRWMYGLWFLVLVRLLVPIHGDVNLMEYLSAKLLAAGNNLTEVGGMTESGEESGYTGTVLDAVGGAKETQKVSDVMQRDSGKTAPEGLQSEPESAGSVAENGQDRAVKAGAGIRAYIVQFAAVIWIAGVFFTAVRKLWIYRRFVKEVCKGYGKTVDRETLSRSGEIRAVCVPVTDERILVQYAEIQRKLRIGKRVPLYESAVIDSPMLIGLRRPGIYLPSRLLAEMTGKENDICLILHHELVHYKRHDIWDKWLFQAALCVHWFNPLLYVFHRKFNIDCELACDETMLQLLSEEGRRAYGNVLLDVARKNWSEGAFSGNRVEIHRNVPAMTLLEEKSTLKERLRGIARYHKTGIVMGLCSAAVLTMFLALAIVCGAADARGSLGETFPMYSRETIVSRFLEPLWEKSLWSEMWKDSFDLDQPMIISTAGKAYRMYDDDALIAEDSENDCWRAWVYTGSDTSVDVQQFAFNGSDTLWIFYAKKETTLEISSRFHLRDGRFKLVCVRPDQTVLTLAESGEKNTVKITLPQGRNVIKMVGQKAKLEDLSIAYGGMKKGDFDGIYDNEATEYAYLVLEGKRSFDSVRLAEICPYLKGKEVSELGRKAWEEGVVLSEEDWQDLFVYSDVKLSAQYLVEELQAGKAGEFDGKTLVVIAPYMRAADVSECFRYLLERDAVSESDWEMIFVYSDANKSAEYLAEALRKGKVSGFSDNALQHICYRVSTGQLTDVVTAMDEMSFESLKYALAFVQKQDEAVACICHYIDLGKALTNAQLREVQGYLSEEDFYRVVEYNGKKKSAGMGKGE